VSRHFGKWQRSRPKLSGNPGVDHVEGKLSGGGEDEKTSGESFGEHANGIGGGGGSNSGESFLSQSSQTAIRSDSN
jgi:hypothetical protein